MRLLNSSPLTILQVVALVCLSCVVPASGAPAPVPLPHPPIPIRFTLTKPSYVTLVIEDLGGRRVRNLISETPFPAGQNTAWWDGLDDLGRDPSAYRRGVYSIPGHLVPPGAYRVRGLVRPQIDLRYLMTPYTEGRPPWLTADRSSGWLTNHTPPQAILFVPAGAAPRREGRPSSAGGQILIGSSVSEGGSGLAWLDLQGRKLHGQEWLGGVWTGVQYLASNSGTKPAPGVYAYTAHAWDDELRLQELRQNPVAAAGDTRLGAGDDVPVLSPTWKFPPGTHLSDQTSERGVGGLAAFNGLVAVSLPVLNRILFVDGGAHRALGTVPLPDPRGLAFDAQGRLLALSGGRLLRYTLPADLNPYVQATAMPEGEALSKEGWTATASQNGAEAMRVVDRSNATRWSSGEPQRPGQWLQIDMGRPQSFTRITLNSPWPPDWGRTYEISTSDDGQNWGSPIAKGEGKPDLLVIDVPRRKARYVKIALTGQADNHWAVNEITLFDKDPQAAAPPAPRPLPAPQVLASGLDDPQNLTVSATGDIYVSLWGRSHNVRVLDADGRFLRTIGKAGEPQAGPYDPAHMNHPVGVTLDDRGRLWVAEEDFQPKRVSVWDAATGKLRNAFYGPQRYGGGGELDPRDKTIYYYDGMALKLDYATQKSHPISVFYRPKPGEASAGGDSVNAFMPQTPIYVGRRWYMTNAYDSNPTNGASVVGLWLMTPKQVARPLVMMGQANDHAFFRDLIGQAENFSVRWTGFITAPQSGDYTFTTVSDDGVRLWVNGQPLIDNWTPHGATEDKGAVHLEAGRPVPIRLEYFQGTGGGTIHLLWQRASGERAAVPSSALRQAVDATQNGLRAEYFAGTDLKDLKAARVDANVDFASPLLPGNPDKAAFAARLPQGANPGRSAWDNSVFFFWQDRNADARMQPQEVTFRKIDGGPIDGVTVMPDASFVVANLNGRATRFTPQGFAPDGMPRYDLGHGQTLVAGAQHPTSSGGGQVLAAPGGWTMLYPATKPYSPYGLSGVKNGKPLWSYPSLWPGLHPSHDSPKPQFPGEMIGTTRLLGNVVTPRGSDVGPLFALNGNMGDFYLMTTDGLFVATVFQDIRLAPTWNFPQAKPGLRVNDTSLHDEAFWPFITQTKDSQIYFSVNGSLVRADGLDQIRRLPAQTLHVTTPMLTAAQSYFVQREAERQAQEADAQKPLTVRLRPNAPVVDGKLDDWQGESWVVVDRKWVGGLGGWGSEQNSVEAALAISGDRLYAAFKTDDANLLANQPQSLTNLFKSGGALDLMLGNVEGGQRLLVAKVGGKTTAMLYRPHDPQAGGEPIKFISNLGANRTVAMDRVENVSDQVTLAQDGNNYELSVPLALLRLQPQAGQTVRGDIGVLRGDGFQTTQRAYWHNKATGLVSDLASEAELTPQLWGVWEFQ